MKIQLLLILVSLFSSESIFAAAPLDIIWSGPIVITKGGTYSGNWRSLNYDVPAVQVNTAEPVIIENCNVTGTGDMIRAWTSPDLIVRNCNGFGLAPEKAGVERGRFITTAFGRRLWVENTYSEHHSAIYVYEFKGGVTTTPIRILRNILRNADGRRKDGTGSQNATFFLINTMKNVAGVEVAWNQVVNEPNNSSVGDNINFFNASGTAEAPIKVHDNYVQGAYPIPATDGFFTGTGMTMDGDGNTNLMSGHLQAYNNQFISTCNAGMNLVTGNNTRFYNNRIVTSGYLADGTKLNATWAGTSTFNFYNVPESAMYNVSSDNNTIGYVRFGGNIPYENRSDLSPGACTYCANNIHLPNPITVDMEKGEWSSFNKKLVDSGVALGSSSHQNKGSSRIGLGGNPVFGEPVGVAPVPAPVPTPSVDPMVYRAINLNGPSLVIEGQTFEASSAAQNLNLKGATWENQNVNLLSPPDANTAKLIRSSIYGNNGSASVEFQNVPSGSYDVYVYTWEDNYSGTFSLLLNAQVVLSNYVSGPAGSWKKLGPFRRVVSDGLLRLSTSGSGDANLSGVMIKKVAETSSPTSAVYDFYKALNLNGASVSVDGKAFSAVNSGRYYTIGAARGAKTLELTPAAVDGKAQMLQTYLSGANLTIEFTGLPITEYQVYVYVIEDGAPDTYDLYVKGKIAQSKVSTGAPGSWKKLGPFKVNVFDSNLSVSVKGGGVANISGIELHKLK